MKKNRVSVDAPTYAAESASGRLRLTTSGSITALLGIVCVAALLLNAVGSHEAVRLRDPILASLAVIVLLILDRFVEGRYGARPSRTVGAIAVAAHALLVEAVTWTDGLTYTLVLYLTLPFPAFFLLGKRVGIAMSAGLFSWFTLKFALFKPGWMSDPATMNTYLLFCICLAVITAMALVVRRERRHRMRTEELLRELEASHTTLEQYAGRVAELAKTEERNRLARDIHDSIGHYLTVVGVQLEKALAVAAESPDEALEAIRTAKRLNDIALTDVRRSVGTLRTSAAPFKLRPALETLIADLEGLPFRAELEFDGDENRLSTQELIALYRSAQEGLTNVQKHARADNVRIAVKVGQESATLSVDDDGIGFSATGRVGGGFGLQGVRERLETLSGRLTVSKSALGGMRMHAVIPRINRSGT